MSLPIQTPLFFKKIGQGQKKLVFLHGLLGFWRNFYSISKSFQKNYNCLLYDQRGHGDSPHYSSYKIEEFAEDLKPLILNFSPANLIAHSLGGYIATYFSYKNPHLVEKLILIDSCPWPNKETGGEIIQLIQSLPESFENRESAKAFFDKMVQNKQLSQTMNFFLMANLKKESTGFMKFKFDKKGLVNVPLEVRNWDYPSLLKSLKIPVLFLRGEFSKHFSKSDFEKTKKLNPLIQAIEIPDSGHWLHAQQTQKVTQILKEFLET